jgi:glycosyltransferase involved in cell wall biosynthesis
MNVDSLTRQLDYLIGNQNAADQHKSAAQQHALENHSWDDIADGFEKFYMHVLQQ